MKETRIWCQTHIVILYQRFEKYHNTKVDIGHNHPLVPLLLVHILLLYRSINKIQAYELIWQNILDLFNATLDLVSLQTSGRVNLGYSKRLEGLSSNQTKRSNEIGRNG